MDGHQLTSGPILIIIIVIIITVIVIVIVIMILIVIVKLAVAFVRGSADSATQKLCDVEMKSPWFTHFSAQRLAFKRLAGTQVLQLIYKS